MKDYSDYYPGKGCICFATCEIECGCDNIDWTPKKVYILKELLREAANFIDKNKVPIELLNAIRREGIDIS